MDETIHATLTGWADFYLITGTAAAALTGLQFVVQTLLASAPRHAVAGGDPETGTAAFGTPTVVHFALALVLSAVLCAPWHAYRGLCTTLGVLGGGALVYSAVVLRRTLRQRMYVPVAEDWLWHIVLPSAAYTAVLAAAVLLADGVEGPLFMVAAATLLLVCIGIHNAWDTVTYLTFNAMRGAAPGGEPAPPRRGEPAKRTRRRR